MQTPPRPTARESTKAMVRNLGREVRELMAALAECRGDVVAEPKVTAALMAHLLISSKELLQNLLMDTVRKPSALMADRGPNSHTLLDITVTMDKLAP